RFLTVKPKLLALMSNEMEEPGSGTEGTLRATAASAATVGSMTGKGGASRVQGVSLRERQKLFTRQQLLDAARAEFAQCGYAQTSVDNIVARAGTSRPTFYVHFGGKVEVLIDLGMALLEEIHDLYRELDVALAVDRPIELRRWFEHALSWWEQHAGL